MQRVDWIAGLIGMAVAGMAVAATASHGRAAEPTPGAEASQPQQATSPEAAATPFVFDEGSQVIVFCYHRFDEVPRDSLSISPKDFRAQMQALRDSGITVISMDDFLAWRRKEKNIPARSAVIGIDDGYVSGYRVAWPILKEFGYPFTMYIYTDFVKGGKLAGGASMTWEQLKEMRDAGVDMGSHTLSHSNLNGRKGRSDAEYREWIKQELGESKRMLEEQLGEIRTLAYPYGIHNETVREVAMEVGYEAAFTVHGQRLTHAANPAMLGRYAIESTKPEVFDSAIAFAGAVASGQAAAGGSAPASETAMPAAASMLTVPGQGEATSDPRPEIKANLATLGQLDPKSVAMQVSSFGQVPAVYDPESQMIRFRVPAELRPRSYTVVVSGRAKGKKVETQWSFSFDRNAPKKPEPTPAPPSEDESTIPEMIPAA